MRRLTPLLLALVLAGAAAGWGGDDDPAEEVVDSVEEEIEDLDTAPDPGDEVEAPEFVLTGEVEPPDDWVLDTANCTDADQSGPPFFDYYVPADWEVVGSGLPAVAVRMGGSEGDHDYEVGGVRDVVLEVEEDTYLDGEVQDPRTSEVFESWDYEADGETITYEELDPVEIDGEDFDLFYLDQASSEEVGASEYATRIVFGEVPSISGTAGERQPDLGHGDLSWDAEASRRRGPGTARSSPPSGSPSAPRRA
ncbi:MAG: hypothetical protein U5R31_08665 [Acidimicrobiia bacterium]|nr:hypothetical protein [Acidimicrobiia bacterium]